MRLLSKKSLSLLVLLCLPFMAGQAVGSEEDLNRRPLKIARGEEGARVVITQAQPSAKEFVFTDLPSDIIRKIGFLLTLGETTEQGYVNLYNYMLTCSKFNANCKGDAPKKNLMYHFLNGFYQDVLDRFNTFPDVLHFDEDDVGAWLEGDDDNHRQSRIVFERFLGDEEGQSLAVRYCEHNWTIPEQLGHTQRLVAFFFWFDACCKEAGISVDQYQMLDHIIGYVAMTDARWSEIYDNSQVIWQVRRALREELLSTDRLRFIPPAVMQLRDRISAVIFSQHTVHIGSFSFVAPILALMPKLEKLAIDEIWPKHILLPDNTRYCHHLTELYLQNHVCDIEGDQSISFPHWVCWIQGLRSLHLDNSDYLVPNLFKIFPNIEVLEVAGCHFAKDPYWVRKLTKLQRLSISFRYVYPPIMEELGINAAPRSLRFDEHTNPDLFLRIDNDGPQELKTYQLLLGEIKAHNKKLMAMQTQGD